MRLSVACCAIVLAMVRPVFAEADAPGDAYGLDDLFEKATDNHGSGLEELYGTRNFRMIPRGVAYRGGANNKWLADGPRDNTNPLPDAGLTNLCEEGFSESYYLYTTNYDDAPKQVSCTSPVAGGRTLTYLQRSASNEDQSYDMLHSVYESIRDRDRGPVYLHCWNGWHASGLIAAKILRQFCGLSAEEAVRYWELNTDGHNTAPRYEGIRRRIREFEPYPEFAITGDEAAMVCPALDGL